MTVFWQLFANDSVTPLEENQEFANTSGSIAFTTGEETKHIVLQAISDKLPEFNEFFVLKLVNISGISYHHLIPESNCHDSYIGVFDLSALVHCFFKVDTQGRVDNWLTLL